MLEHLPYLHQSAVSAEEICLSTAVRLIEIVKAIHTD